MITHAERDTILNGYNSHFAALLTAFTALRAGTVTEASYTGYARSALTLGAVANTAPTGGRQRANSAVASFGQKTNVGTQDVIGWGLYAASSGGSPKWLGFLDADAPIIGAVEDVTADRIVAYGHGFSVDQRIYVLAAPGAVIPTGLAEDTAYYVGTVPDANHFTLSTTPANANPVAITVGGAAQFIAYTPVTIAQNATPEFAIGALVVQL